ncbi:Leucine rich repeat/Leucine Rich repeat/Leucine Rich Repeat [Novymonas esmeraldas]|uniref:Leucine rich repeat/Leucine Rich repeat/Leucine Rich Repeat n=1 Tax=Novymonas esmeraldas TaxID=1808958 RepID=A0AAW0ETI1_9TRYP
MDLDFSNRGLFAFDAVKARSALTAAATTAASQRGGPAAHGSGRASEAASTPPLPAIRQLNLSYNALHLFTGGDTLKGLTVLDLSHNALAQLHGQSLPPSLVRLSVAHNKLSHLADLATHTPRLQVLEAGHNHLTTAALRDLPRSVTHVGLEGNELESLAPLSSLPRLTHVNVARNQLEDANVLLDLRPLTSLRHLDLRGNPLCDVGGVDLKRLLRDVLPRLAHLDGVALSQVPVNHAQLAAHRLQQSSHSSDAAGRRGEGLSGGSSLLSSTQRQRAPPQAGGLEVRLMQAKVRELRRLLAQTQEAEETARQQRALLVENVKSTAAVIDQQGAELARLQAEVLTLHSEHQKLKPSVAAAEHSFEQVHASLLACKAKNSACHSAVESSTPVPHAP